MFAKITIALIITVACSPVATGNLTDNFSDRRKVMAERIISKRCSKCKQIKSLSEFDKSNRNKDGSRFACKQCRKQYYQQNKTKILQSCKQYRQTHKTERKQYYKTLRGYLHHVWDNMLQRCNNPKATGYNYYGGRGIKVKFNSFDDFYDYVVNELKADPTGLNIDRINNNGDYQPGNIRFVTHKENCRNRK